MMKNILATLLFAFALVATATAQKDFEGVVTFAVEYKNLPPEMEAMRSMMPSESVMYVKDDQTRTEQTMNGMQQFTIENSTDASVTSYVDLMGKKIALVLSDEELKQAQEVKKGTTFKVEKGDKKILKYDCKKGTITTPEMEGQSMVFEVWYTDKFVNNSTQFSEAPGMVLEYNTTLEGLSITYTASEIKEKKLDEALFVGPKDYERTTQGELMEMIGN